MQDDDDGRVWRAVNWKGELVQEGDLGEARERRSHSTPTDEEFKERLECISNPPGAHNVHVDEYRLGVYMPITDDPIDVSEVMEQTQRLKMDKASGPDGVSPGLLKVLPAQWLITLTTLFNVIFNSGCYPKQ